MYILALPLVSSEGIFAGGSLDIPIDGITWEDWLFFTVSNSYTQTISMEKSLFKTYLANHFSKHFITGLFKDYSQSDNDFIWVILDENAFVLADGIAKL